MTKTEAAEILATFVMAQANKRGVKVIDKTFIAECISVARYQRDEGTRLHAAAVLRPADSTIKTAGQRITR